ncbi:hypothetical protein FNU76_10820 [Chitinimonas arctica]|uniref:2OG-Fe(II) oxygenase n=1 Tax=Chitinimonas arctica TaxID=2594795 RepID=A0A516SFL1_9NEIS|nr:2OG-Fe(II) oxygenase family protein [Chitinimonas arctica]QDQ26818.1 hypothetical protein FNU76_10820 [Chitinimonas arctica]
MPDARLHRLFATPLLLAHHPAPATINAALLEMVRTLQRGQAGEDVSNIGGWHSKGELFALDNPALRELHALILSSLGQALGEMDPALQGVTGQVRVTGWANVLPAGAYHTPHHHPGQAWSGCYYLAVPTLPGQGKAGRLEVFDPRNGADMLPQPGRFFSPSALIDPEPGLLVLFPAWLRHMVHPHPGPDERVSIAFNLSFDR